MKQVWSCGGGVQEAIKEHNPSKVFACFSGGHDSLVSTHIAMTGGYASEVLHINTGIGIKDTRQFVRDTCQEYGWPLKEVHPPEKTYRDFVLQHGFPGPGSHRYCYSWLKERALRIVVREAKTNKKSKVMLITGVRLSESTRRMGYVNPVTRFGSTVWVAPIFDFSHEAREAYIAEHWLERNPVSDRLGMSGECLCGAFARPKEMEKLELFYPDAAKEIHDLEQEVTARGLKAHHWGTNREGDRRITPMCVGCDNRQILLGEAES